MYSHVNMTKTSRLLVQCVDMLFMVKVLQYQWSATTLLMNCNISYDKRVLYDCKKVPSLHNPFVSQKPSKNEKMTNFLIFGQWTLVKK